MSLTRWLASLAALLLALFLLPLGGESFAQQIQQVFITNWPSVLSVEGTVVVDEPVKLARFTSIREIVVPPVERVETTRLVDAGTIVTDGFPNVVLSLHGTVKGTVKREGGVGVILIPEEEVVQEAFFEQGLLHFALETVADGITARTPYFASHQPRFTVAFPRYRALLYNTTDKAVSANLFAYLTQ